MTFDLGQNKVLVFGLGISGSWAARWLASLGAVVRIVDSREMELLDPGVCSEMAGLGVSVETGFHRKSQVENVDLIVISPGIPLDIPALKHARSLGIPVLGEMELASRFVHSPIIAVTGTNGKSTVTSLIGAMLAEGGCDVFVGGNLGTPLSALAASGAEPDWAVLEVSSFQLDTVEFFRPYISVILNITPDHLDRYPDYQAYVSSKMRIFACQSEGHSLVVNDEDPMLAAVSPPQGVKKFSFGVSGYPGRQAYFQDGRVVVKTVEDEEAVEISIARARLVGRHNIENIIASALVARLAAVDAPSIQRAVDRFEGLPHRMELVCEQRGVAFYDDSKATNAAAAASAVSGIDRPVILIAGGRGKGEGYGPLVEAAKGKVKAAVFIGESKRLLAKAFKGLIPFETAVDMEEAVKKAVASAVPGDAVLLAPACSSFDMFKDYAQRGSAFAAAVERIANG
ncbi:MAG: UDP-N-acetylmuramoyl-L-alanine--D-glutamate ligase [Desulfatiglandaceae bacterium]